MKKWPDKTQSAIRKLHQLNQEKAWRKGTEGEKSILRLLQKLSAAGEPQAMPVVLDFLLIPVDSIRAAARECLLQLMSLVSPYDLLCLKDCFHSHWDPCYFAPEREARKTSEIRAVADSLGEVGRLEVLGLLSFHRNGYVRHEALQQLAQLSEGRELPFLLIGQNDWVPLIARDARVAVAERIHSGYREHFAHCLRLVVHLSSFERHDHQEMVNRILDLFLNEFSDKFLRSFIESEDRKVRRSVVQYGLSKTDEQSEQVLVHGLVSEDHKIRFSCCQKMRSCADAARQREVLEQLATDSFMPIRREALRIQVLSFPESALEVWQSALFDASRSVREWARVSLKHQGYEQSVFADRYRQRIASQPEFLPALEGLAETGDERDLEFFRELLQHRFPNRRVAAINGLSRILKEAAITELLPSLWDETPAVFRAVGKVIRPVLYLVDNNNTLLQVALGARFLAARLHAVDLIAESGKWNSLPWLLTLAREAEQDTAHHAIQRMEKWLLPPGCNKVFVHPTAQNRQDIADSLAKSQGLVPERTLAMLEHELSRFS